MLQTPDPLSLTTLLLEIYRDHHYLGSASGFVIQENKQFYLATNQHVVTGDVNSGIPTKISVWFHEKSNKFKWRQIEIPLCDNDEEKKWLEHPLGKAIDAVLLPIQVPEQIQLYPLNLDLAKSDIHIKPAQPISVIGFPGGQTAGEKLPIWVTGFIASEPHYDIHGLPVLYINISGFCGLSGSPVVLRTSGIYYKNDGSLNIGHDNITKFLGIYSGRLISKKTLEINKKQSCSDDETKQYNQPEALLIGKVWKPIVFEQILEKANS